MVRYDWSDPGGNDNVGDDNWILFQTSDASSDFVFGFEGNWVSVIRGVTSSFTPVSQSSDSVVINWSQFGIPAATSFETALSANASSLPTGSALQLDLSLTGGNLSGTAGQLEVPEPSPFYLAAIGLLAALISRTRPLSLMRPKLISSPSSAGLSYAPGPFCWSRTYGGGLRLGGFDRTVTGGVVRPAQRSGAQAGREAFASPAGEMKVVPSPVKRGAAQDSFRAFADLGRHLLRGGRLGCPVASRSAVQSTPKGFPPLRSLRLAANETRERGESPQGAAQAARGESPFLVPF